MGCVQPTLTDFNGAPRPVTTAIPGSTADILLHVPCKWYNVGKLIAMEIKGFGKINVSATAIECTQCVIGGLRALRRLRLWEKSFTISDWF